MNKETVTAIVPRRGPESLVPDAVNMSMIAKKLLDSGMWPKFKNEAQVFAAAEYGRELGLGPVMSLNTIFPVNGQLSMMAQAMLAVAHQRAEVTWKVDSSTAKGCSMTFMRPGFDPIKVTFDEADAKAAGLLGKDNWIKYPKAMYLSKASSAGVRQIAPDAIVGLYSIEEMQDISPDIMPAAGEIREVMPEPQKELKAEKKEEPEKEKPSESKTEPKPTTKATPEPKSGTKTKPAEQAKPATTPVKDEKEIVIENIKAMIAKKTFDPKHFKIFLYDFAKTHKVKFVELNRFKNLSFHEGDYNDLCKLILSFEWLSNEYLKWAKTYQPQAEEDSGTGEEPPPF